MADMLVPLYKDRPIPNKEKCIKNNIQIQRALAIDKQEICSFVNTHFHEICPGWVDECASSLYRHPPSCFLAIKEKKIIGFACYDGTAKGMVGPIGVVEQERKQGIASLLLHTCFEAMKMEGYAYAIIGWVSSTDFYKKVCNAIEIPDSFPGIYERMIMHN